MCLILFAWQVHPHFPLIVAANRDEFYQRPTAISHFWPALKQQNTILAGKDLQQQGTWLGINNKGHFAALTNYRDGLSETKPHPSRGLIIRDYLLGNDNSEYYLKHHSFQQYAGFSCLLGDINTLYYYSNHENKITPLSPGIYGLSNGLLNSPWPKIETGKQTLENILSTTLTTNDLVKSLFTLLQNTDHYPDDKLPHTGIDTSWERTLSPRFIHAPQHHYGTRSSTVLLSNIDQGFFNEQTYNELGNKTELKQHTISYSRNN